MNSFLSDLQETWCKLMHPAPRWPINGYYECPTCLRRYPVPWANHPVPSTATTVKPLPSKPIGIRRPVLVATEAR